MGTKIQKIALLLAAGIMLLPLWPAGQTPAPRTAKYEKDVLPALESAVCVRRLKFRGRTTFIAPPRGCPDDPSLTPLQKELAHAAADTLQLYPYQTSCLFSLAAKNTPQSPGRKENLLRAYRARLFANPVIRRTLMPRVHSILTHAGLVCPDCPGPAAAPRPEKVTTAQLMPYALAFLWPAGLRPDGYVTLRVCVGINGLGRISRPDPLLVEAAFHCVFMNGKVMMAAEDALKTVARQEAYRSLKTQKEKLEFLRIRLSRRLASDPRFVSLIRERALKTLPVYGLECSDCGTTAGAGRHSS